MAQKTAQELDTVLNLYKRKSETPLQTVERYVASHPEFAKSKMTYAGRLDPMAEGVLVVLTGEKNKERDTYTGLDKDYEFEFIFGVETDTFDVLGKITHTKTVSTSLDASMSTPFDMDISRIETALKKYTGTFEQKYPSYSSKVINGVQMFELARMGMLLDKDIPTHAVTAQSIEYIGSRTVSIADMRQKILDDIHALTGDFRQQEICKLWNEYFEKEGTPQSFVIHKARVSCGSGFYVRQLVSDIGRDLGFGAVTISILRTRVGDFVLKDSLR